MASQPLIAPDRWGGLVAIGTKKTKNEVGYEHPAKGAKHCEDCRFFEVKGPKQCLKVQGKILPQDWCRLWRRRNTEHAAGGKLSQMS